jgi:hypothetical protein
MTGTVFTVYDHGQPCQMNAPLAMADVLPARREIGLVLYERNILGWEPREFQVALPSCVNLPPPPPHQHQGTAAVPASASVIQCALIVRLMLMVPWWWWGALGVATGRSRT